MMTGGSTASPSGWRKSAELPKLTSLPRHHFDLEEGAFGIVARRLELERGAGTSESKPRAELLASFMERLEITGP